MPKDKYTMTQIMRRCGQLGIDYNKIITTEYGKKHGWSNPNGKVQYNDGVRGKKGKGIILVAGKDTADLDEKQIDNLLSYTVNFVVNDDENIQRKKIPNEITKEHILQALEEIDVAGVKSGREATKWYVHHAGKNYPPKYVVSIAGKHALGVEFSHKYFSGGNEVNSFLRNRGFKIIPKSSVGGSITSNLSNSEMHKSFNIIISDFVAFVKSQAGRTLQTRSQHRKFTVKVTNTGFEYTPASSTQVRHHPIDEMERVIEQFSETGSFNTGDYSHYTACSSYTLTLIDLFLKEIEGESGISSYSWTIKDRNTSFKILDKSAFLHRGTGIPVEVRSFFKADKMQSGERIRIKLYYGTDSYDAHVEMDLQDSPRTRLFWSTEFSKEMHKLFPHHYKQYSDGNKDSLSQLIMKFDVLEGDHLYAVSFTGDINQSVIEQDIQSEIDEDNGSHTKEGAVREYFGKRYERDPANRKKAIKIHGLTCKVCNFNFEEIYGERGADFIEVHHRKPIHTFEGQAQTIDPQIDLVPLCSNCHRMIHRRSDNVLTVKQLQEIINSCSQAVKSGS